MTALTDPATNRALRIVIWGLLLIYCLPLLLIAISFFWTNQFDTAATSGIVNGFVGLVGISDESLGLVHRAILPLMAGLAPIAFASKDSASSTTYLMLLLLAAIGLSIFLNAVFHSEIVVNHLRVAGVFSAPRDGQPATAEEAEAALNLGIELVSSFLNRTQETMSMYLLMLFGLTLARKE